MKKQIIKQKTAEKAVERVWRELEDSEGGNL